MKRTTYCAVVAAVLMLTVACAGSARAAAPVSAGNIFTETFAGGVFTTTGGTSVMAGDNLYLSAPRDGIVFDYTINAAGNGEYRGELDVPLEPTDEFVVALEWLIDSGSWLTENAALMRAYDLSGDMASLLQVEAKEAGGGGGPTFDLEVQDAGGNQGYLGLTLSKGASFTLTAHNRGDGNGTVDLYVNDNLVGTYTNRGGTLEWLGNLGNISTGLGFHSALLSDVSVGTPVPPPEPPPAGVVFFETFPGGAFDTFGGTSAIAGNNLYLSAGREGVVFDHTIDALSNGEYRGELDNPLETDVEFIVDMTWTVDGGSVLAENSAILRAYDLTDNLPSLLRIEAKEDVAGHWTLEVQDAVSQALVPGLSLLKGVPQAIRAHNVGDGSVGLHVNGGLVGTYQNRGGTLEWLGNVGNISTGLGFSSALLADLTIWIPTSEAGTVIILQ